MKKFTCCLCKRRFEGWGNNPWPFGLNENDLCCKECNMKYVIMARLNGITREMVLKEFYGKN